MGASAIRAGFCNQNVCNQSVLHHSVTLPRGAGRDADDGGDAIGMAYADRSAPALGRRAGAGAEAPRLFVDLV